MGVSLLLPLLLLVQTCIPGRAGSPTPALGTESDGGKGRKREKRGSRESDELEDEGGSVPSPPTQIIIVLLSAAPHSTDNSGNIT